MTVEQSNAPERYPRGQGSKRTLKFLRRDDHMSLLGQVADKFSGGKLTKRSYDKRLSRYLETGQRKSGDGEILTDAFLMSAGEWLTQASETMSLQQGKYDFSSANDILGLWAKPGSKDSALQRLRRDGYAILDTKLDSATVSELSTKFEQAPCTLTSDKATSLAKGETVKVDLERPLAEKYAVDTNFLLSTPTVRNLLLDRGLLEIAQDYIGSAPIVDILTSWYSFPSDSPSHEAAQLFHFDLDRIRWMKVFFLLTDQTVETGAHLYVPGTHRDGGIPRELLDRGYARLEDYEVARHFPETNWKSMVAPAGSILLEDTRGLHKGISLKRDHRLMLQFEYTQTLFGHEPFIATIPFDRVSDSYWNEMRSTYPKVFEAINER